MRWNVKDRHVLPLVNMNSPHCIAGKTVLDALRLPLCLGFALYCASSAAQVSSGAEQGSKPSGSYDVGDVDSVSMLNGTLSLHIPLISYPQRGGKLHLGFSVVYSNPVYAFTNNRVNGICPLQDCYTWDMGTTQTQFTPDTTGNNANRQLLSIVPDVPSMTATLLPCCAPAIDYYNILEPDLAVHKTGQINSSSNQWMSVDTTGYAYYASSGTLVDRSGTNYSFNVVSGYPGSLGLISDVYGNYITVNQTTGFVDTLGRTIPKPLSTSTSDFSGCTGQYPTSSAYLWSVPGPNVGTSQFKIFYAAFPLS
jgi:hypothetical protein